MQLLHMPLQLFLWHAAIANWSMELPALVSRCLRHLGCSSMSAASHAYQRKGRKQTNKQKSSSVHHIASAEVARGFLASP